MDIVATEVGVLVESEGYYINENRYYGGTIGGGCNYGIKLVSGAYETSTNKFLSGGIEGIADEGRGIYIENSSNNIFRNIRTLEYYGKYILTFKGLSKRNDIEIPTVNLAEVDISELGTIGNDNNVIKVITSSLDGSTNIGSRIEINGNYGFVYDTKMSKNALNHTKISLTNFPDSIIKPIDNRIYTSFQSTVASLNGATITLGEIYYGNASMIKGEPIVIWFGDGSGRIKLVDVDGNEIFDATDGKFDNKTISVKWCGYDAHNGKHIWFINVAGETNMDGVGIQSVEKTATDGLVDTYTITLSNEKTETFTVTNGSAGQDGINGEDGYTPIKGTDYFTTEDIAEILDAVYAKVADGNEVAY